jgi:uncharacterized protein (TIGR02246 family)
MMRTGNRFFLMGGLLAFLTIVLMAGQGQRAAQPSPAKNGQDAARTVDDGAIRKQTAAFVQIFNKGDAKALAGLWTLEGEYIDDDGSTYRGRAAIEATYAEFFAKNPKAKLEVEIDSIRFIAKDNAVEEGYAKARVGKSESSGRYSILHVREGGKWCMALVREWPSEGTALRDIDWLIGTWASDADNTHVRTTYEWDDGKRFIRGRFTIKGKDNVLSGTQMIGLDPRTGKLRSWIFEAEGGFGEAVWTRDGKRWLQEAAGIQGDGSEITATNILTPVNRDAFTFQSTSRVVDGDEVANTPPIKITRVK